jgi:hypothetical protein
MSLYEHTRHLVFCGILCTALDDENRPGYTLVNYFYIPYVLCYQVFYSTNGVSTSSSFLHSKLNNHRTLLLYRVLKDDLLFTLFSLTSKSNRLILNPHRLSFCGAYIR